MLRLTESEKARFRLEEFALHGLPRRPTLGSFRAALGMFKLDGLILTKLDETRTFGSLYNFARRSQTPLGYFTTGKETARHLEVADPARLAAALFGRDWSRA